MKTVSNLWYLNYVKLIVLVLVISCSNDQRMELPSEHLIYWSDEHNFVIKEDTYSILYIPVNSCSPCVEASLELVLANEGRDFYTFILANSTKDIDTSEFSKISNVHIDLTGKFNFYDLGVYGPTLIKIEDNFLKEYISLNEDLVKGIRQKLDNDNY